MDESTDLEAPGGRVDLRYVIVLNFVKLLAGGEPALQLFPLDAVGAGLPVEKRKDLGPLLRFGGSAGQQRVASEGQRGQGDAAFDHVAAGEW